MSLVVEGYKRRLIDEKIERYLKIFGAISLEGPKWCGKTWTAKNHANSAVFLDDSTNNFENRVQSLMDISLILDKKAPELIDEWSNESSMASNSTLISDIKDITNNKEYQLSRNTIRSYIDTLSRLYLLENQEAFSTNLRSKKIVGKNPKRHFTVPSLSCAALGITKDKLMNDISTFGFMFESLVERDLRIYIESLDGKLYHYRNNKNGIEVDAIVELPSGEYGAIEIKLGANEIEDAKKSLIKFSSEVNVEPKFKCIICGLWNAVVKDPETGIYIIPITALKP